MQLALFLEISDTLIQMLNNCVTFKQDRFLYKLIVAILDPGEGKLFSGSGSGTLATKL